MKSETFDMLTVEIIELKQQIELAESDYKYALELQKDSLALMRTKEQIKLLKEKLETMINHPNRKVS